MRRRRSSWAAAGVALAMLSGLSGCSCERSTDARSGRASEDEPGELAPDFSLKDLQGGSVTLSEHRGKVVLVDFWATWCPPCEFQVPELNKLLRAHVYQQDLTIIGVSVDVDGAEVVVPWVEKHGVEYSIVLGDEKLAHEYGAMGFPTMAIIAPDGRLDSLHVGLVEYDELEEMVSALVPASG